MGTLGASLLNYLRSQRRAYRENEGNTKRTLEATVRLSEALNGVPNDVNARVHLIVFKWNCRWRTARYERMKGN